MLTEIAEMHGSVKPSLAEYHHSSHFVKEYVVVEWQHLHEAHPPQQRDGVPHDEEENKDRVEVQAEPVGPRKHEEVVGLSAITLVPSPLSKMFISHRLIAIIIMND